MGIDLRREPHGDGRVVVWVSGDLDLSTRDSFVDTVREVLAGGEPTAVIIDLSGVRFLDAVGIGGLLRARSLALTSGVTMEVRGPKGMVETVLRITRADEVLGTAPTVPSGPEGPG
jgi:anti-sigma B factor antagonist